MRHQADAATSAGLKGCLTALFCVICLAAAPAAAKPPASRHHPRHTHRAVRPAPPAQIACTVLGCIPVPRECGQTYERTLDGIPTGYDVIVCPPGIWPLK